MMIQLKNTWKLTALVLITTITVASAATLKTETNDSQFLGKKKVFLSSSEQDAEIFIDGKLMGSGEVEVIILKNSCVTVRVKKVGFLSHKIVFCNKKNSAKPPKTYHAELKKDDAFDSSVQTDLANVDVEVASSNDEKKAWKLLSQIVTSYFDVVEITDRDTGYLRTSWTVKSFKQATIRTRVILRESSSSPLKYKIKLVSEIADYSGASVKKDENFEEWDRILRKYKNLISELQTRL